MTGQDAERNEGVAVDPREVERLTESDERRMFQEAILESAPEISREELEALRGEGELEPEQAFKPESQLAVRGTPTKANVAVSPYRYGGVIYCKKKPDDVLWTGMGTAEFVGESNILLTAAHCVRDNETGAYFTGFVFYRAYENQTYARKFSINYVATKAGWVLKTPQRYQYDYAFLRTTSNSDVGYMGYKTLGAELSWTEFGYPLNYGNNQVMYKVDGSRGRVVEGTVEMLGNPMRKGNSGGAWFVTAGPNFLAMGNESHNEKGNITDTWGPVYNNSTFDLLAFVHNAK